MLEEPQLCIVAPVVVVLARVCRLPVATTQVGVCVLGVGGRGTAFGGSEGVPPRRDGPLPSLTRNVGNALSV